MTEITVTRSAASLERELNTARAAWVVTDLQFALACVASQILSEQEAELWVADGTLPQLAIDALATLPDDGTRAAARIRFRGAKTIARLDPFIDLLRDQLEMTDAQVDALFQGAMQL